MTIDPLLRPGCAIHHMRKSKGWSAKQLSAKSGVSPSQIYKIEKDNTGGWSTVMALLQAVGLTVSVDVPYTPEIISSAYKTQVQSEPSRT